MAVVFLHKIIPLLLMMTSLASSLASSSRLVVVSGGNRGVGVGVCRQVLAQDPTAEVLVTARNLNQAETVCKELNEEYKGRAKAHCLDVTDEKSCQLLAEYLSKSCDCGSGSVRPFSLVNNAGVAYDLPWFPSPWPVEAVSNTLGVNLFGAERLTRMLLPYLLQSQDGRVINLSSGGGRLNMSKMSEQNRSKLLDDSITWDEIQKMASTFTAEYEEAAQTGIRDEKNPQLPFLSPSGFWLQAYGFSKACLGAYTQIISRDYPSLLSIACSPGFIATDMSKTYAKYDTLKTVDEGGNYVAQLVVGDKESLTSGVFYQPGQGIVSFVAD